MAERDPSEQNIHLEFTARILRTTLIVDVLNVATGDVYEIEPLGGQFRAVREAEERVDLLNYLSRRGGLSRDYAYRGNPAYNWSSVSFWLGSPGNFPRIEIPWGSAANLVAMGTVPGAVLYWFEPTDPSPVAVGQFEEQAEKEAKKGKFKIPKPLRKPYGFKPPLPSPIPAYPINPLGKDFIWNAFLVGCYEILKGLGQAGEQLGGQEEPGQLVPPWTTWPIWIR